MEDAADNAWTSASLVQLICSGIDAGREGVLVHAGLQYLRIHARDPVLFLQACIHNSSLHAAIVSPQAGNRKLLTACCQGIFR